MLNVFCMAVVASSLLVGLYNNIKCIFATEAYLKAFVHLFQLSVPQLCIALFRGLLMAFAFLIAGFHAKLAPLWFLAAAKSTTFSLLPLSLLLSSRLRGVLEKKYEMPKAEDAKKLLVRRARYGLIWNGSGLSLWAYAWSF